MRSGHVAVIGGEDGYGIAGLPALIQRVQQAADLRVELLSESVVVRAALPVIVFGDGPQLSDSRLCRPGLPSKRS